MGVRALPIRRAATRVASSLQGVDQALQAVAPGTFSVLSVSRATTQPWWQPLGPDREGSGQTTLPGPQQEKRFALY